MPKRAERRHHAARIKEKFKQVAKRWAGTAGRWMNGRRWAWQDGKFVNLGNYVDRTGGVERLKYIEETTNKLAAHHNCDRGMRHGNRFDRHKDVPPDDEYE